MTSIPSVINHNGLKIAPDAARLSETSVPGCPGWRRGFGEFGELSMVRWTGPGGIVLVDVMSRATDHLLEIDVDGTPDLIRPLAGRGYSSAHPGEAKIEKSAADVVTAKLLARDPIDHYLTHEGGSPRESGIEAYGRLARREGGLSPLARDYLGAWVEAQLHRPYQDPDHAGIPSGLTGVAHVEAKGCGASGWIGVPYWAAHCPCHATVEKLATAYTETGSPRALDQLIRLMVHMLRTEYYLELEPDQYGRVSVNGFYSYSPRMIGWPLKAVATTLRVLRHAAKIDPDGGTKLAALLGPRMKAFAEHHIKHVLDRWGHGVWSPFETSDSTGGHSKEPHDVVFMQSVLAMGARECWKEAAATGAFGLYRKSAFWIDANAWELSGDPIAICYDALRSGGGTGIGTVNNGVRLWTVQAMTGTGTGLERALIAEARRTNFWNVPDVDTRNNLLTGLEWIPDEFRASVEAAP